MAPKKKLGNYNANAVLEFLIVRYDSNTDAIQQKINLWFDGK
jgi:hypothetical protein